MTPSYLPHFQRTKMGESKKESMTPSYLPHFQRTKMGERKKETHA